MAQVSRIRPGVQIRHAVENFIPSRQWGWDEVMAWCTERGIHVDYVLDQIYDESVIIDDPKYLNHQLHKTWYVIRFVSEADAMLFKLSWVHE
jgi:hypothetical protein